jgi:hypothetical protein
MLRAKRSDIDAFAGGKLDPNAFKSKVAITAYPGSGAGGEQHQFLDAGRRQPEMNQNL